MEKIIEYALSTEDNPYNPWTEFDEWYAFDEGKGYHTLSYLDRLNEATDELSYQDYIFETNKAIEEILRLNLTGNYIKVANPNPESPEWN